MTCEEDVSALLALMLPLQVHEIEMVKFLCLAEWRADEIAWEINTLRRIVSLRRKLKTKGLKPSDEDLKDAIAQIRKGIPEQRVLDSLAKRVASTKTTVSKRP